VTETCHPENPFQLIVKVQTESNNTDDAAMLVRQANLAFLLG
jgi:hypothetical protein